MSFVRASSLVYNDLKAHQPLVDLLSRGSNGINPLIASEKEEAQFINYFVEDNGLLDKDKIKRWVVTVHSYAGGYDMCCQIADKVTEALGSASTQYIQLGGKPRQSEEGWLFIEQRFNIKI